jgi:hypothetical protein
LVQRIAGKLAGHALVFAICAFNLQIFRHFPAAFLAPALQRASQAYETKARKPDQPLN